MLLFQNLCPRASKILKEVPEAATIRSILAFEVLESKRCADPESSHAEKLSDKVWELMRVPKPLNTCA